MLWVFQGMVFVIWMFLAFRWLFALRADAVAASGTVLPGPGWAVRAFRGGLVDKRYAKDRLWLGISTVVLLSSSLVSFLR
jgi:hypothetical protein